MTSINAILFGMLKGFLEIWTFFPLSARFWKRVQLIFEDLDIFDDLTSIPVYANDEKVGNQESSSSSSQSRTSSSYHNKDYNLVQY
jgi:hypothetical protein